MKYIAFYLPQFHDVKENNEWWGNGFTEWTNVTTAKPLFEGHYQPQIPKDLGFYNLMYDDIKLKQEEMALEYGIDAFCYYHYWFNGKLLLEKPLEQKLKNKDLTLPFCLCWANESWTKIWDGLDNEVLIEHNVEKYNPVKHIEWLKDYFLDDRYLKINGKPVFLVWRVDKINNIEETIQIWRNEVKKYGIDDLYIIISNHNRPNYNYQRMREIGFDAAYDFEPNAMDMEETKISANLSSLNMYDYEKIITKKMQKKWTNEMTVYPTVFPSWDNTPRKKWNATIYQNENPFLYGKWLKNSMEAVKDNSVEEQIVFINAWNEWAEGCHLEPDLKHGRNFLEMTKHIKEQNNFEIIFTEDNKKLNYEKENIIAIDYKTPIYIWGAGKNGREFIEKYSSEINILGIIDSNESIVGTNYNDIPIISSKDLPLMCKSDAFIIICSSFYSEIINTLKEHNFKESSYAINAEVRINYLDGKKQILVGKFRTTYCNYCFQNSFDKEFYCTNCNSSPEERFILKFVQYVVDETKDYSVWQNYSYYNIYYDKESPKIKTVLNKNFNYTDKNYKIKEDDKFDLIITYSNSEADIEFYKKKVTKKGFLLVLDMSELKEFIFNKDLFIEINGAKFEFIKVDSIKAGYIQF